MSSDIEQPVSAPADSQIQPPLALSPTPSEILKPEGFMPHSPCPSTKEEDDNEDEKDEAAESESPTSEMENDEDDNEEAEEEKPKINVERNVADDDNNGETTDNDKGDSSKPNDSGQQDVDSGIESERDGFNGFEPTEADKPSTPVPAPPKVG